MPSHCSPHVAAPFPPRCSVTWSPCAALGSDLRRAAGAIAVIGHCLHQPTGHFGRVLEPEEILSWEDDDLATSRALDTIGRATSSPLIRRLVREHVSWSAELARSPQLQHAALTLATYLDEQEDTVQELLLDTWTTLCPPRRGKPVPTISDLIQGREARRIEMAGLTEAQRAQAESERVHKKIEDRHTAHQALAAQAITPMTTGGDPSQFIGKLDSAIRELREALPDRHISLWHFWAEVEKEATAHLRDIVREISALPPGPLDHELHQVLRHWQLTDEPGLLRWLENLEDFRAEVRLAVGVAFDAFSWADAGPKYTEIHTIGVLDPDKGVRQRFLSAAHPLLRATPAATVAELMAAGISPGSALNALQQTCGTSPTQWGSSLPATDAASVLELIARAGWEDWTVGHIVGGIAATHPDLVLNRLLGASRGGQLPSEVESLGEALASRPQLFVDWLAGALDQEDLVVFEPVVSLVWNAGLTDSHGALLAARATGWTLTQRLKFVRVLRDVSTWPLRQPRLARALIGSGELSGLDDAEALRAEIEDATHLRSWGLVNGTSDELNSARDAALAAATTEHHPVLREMFKSALIRLTAHIEDARQREADDHDWPEE